MGAPAAAGPARAMLPQAKRLESPPQSSSPEKPEFRFVQPPSSTWIGSPSTQFIVLARRVAFDFASS